MMEAGAGRNIHPSVTVSHISMNSKSAALFLQKRTWRGWVGGTLPAACIASSQHLQGPAPTQLARPLTGRGWGLELFIVDGVLRSLFLMEAQEAPQRPIISLSSRESNSEDSGWRTSYRHARKGQL